MLAYYKLDEIYTTIGEAEGGIKSICKMHIGGNNT